MRFAALLGTLSSTFQLGKNGSFFRGGDSTHIDARNVGDSAFVTVRAATPVTTDDVATKGYVDTRIIGATVAANGTGSMLHGVTSTAKNSTGNYTVTVPANTSANPVVSSQTVGMIASVIRASGTTFTVLTSDAAGVAADAAFNFVAVVS